MFIKFVIPVFVATIFILTDSLAINKDITIDARFRGEWVSAKAACTSTLRIKLETSSVTFINGSDSQKYDKLDQCYSCMGKDISDYVWLTTEAMGDSPFTIYLDGTKKQVAVSVDFTNDKKLGKRFPFDAKALKRCK